jgi:hypothetical protein
MFKKLRQLFSGSPQKEPDTEPVREELVPPTEPQSTYVPEEQAASEEGPEVYLARVQAKINRLAEEFAEGTINQAQFQELFDHYRREKQTVQRWLEIAPESDAWKESTTEGKSVIIRTGHEAKVLGYAIYENNSGMPLNTIGQFELEPELVVPMLSSYRAATREIFGAGMSSSEIEGGRWLCFVPGEFTTLMALLSTSPASRQLESMEDLHRLFEKANRNFLEAELVDPSKLVFPHAFFLGRIT